MELHQILLGENDGFLRDCRKSVHTQPASDKNIPEVDKASKFAGDVNALREYVGESDFQSGLCIELTLAQMLQIAPRKRQRTDAYNSLVKHLKNNNIILKIKRR